MTLYGLNALNQGRPLGDLICFDIAAQGFQSVRSSASYDNNPWAPIPEKDLKQLVYEIAAAGMVPYITVRGGESVDLLPTDAGVIVEHGNEPNLKKLFGWPSLSFYVSSMFSSITSCERKGFPCYVGAVSNLNNDALSYLKKVFREPIPEWCGASVHWYPDQSSPHEGHDGRSREQEIQRLREIVGDRSLALSEISYHRQHGLTEEQVAANYAFEREFWARHNFDHAIAYQINDAPGVDPLSKDGSGGFKALDGTWKLRTRAWTGVNPS